jgi:hypothetical protein
MVQHADLDHSGLTGIGVVVQDEGTPLATTGTTLNFVGAGVAATGSGATKTITIAGGGSLTTSYLGYNTVGGTAAAAAQGTNFMKPITPGSDVLLLSVEVYFISNTEGVNPKIYAAVLSDNAGAPYLALRSGFAEPLVDTTNGGGGLVARWFGPPIAPVLLTSGTQYWLQVGYTAGGNYLNFYRDGSGNDRSAAASGLYGDAGFHTVTTLTDRYSIRALCLAL